MAATTFLKGLMMYLVIGLFLTVMGGPDANGLNNQLADSFVNTTTGDLSSEFKNTMPNVDEETGGGEGVLAFIDTLKAVRNFISFVGTVVLAVPMVLFDAQLPEMIQLAFGIPTTVAFFVGLIYLARSGT